MYLHLGQSVVVPSRDIIGIFDLEITTQSARTRKYLDKSEKAGNVVNVSEELPKSFIVCEKKGENTVYISQISPSTLFKRSRLSF